MDFELVLMCCFLFCSMSYQRTQEMKLVANLKDKYKEMIECPCLTRNIKNWAESDKY